MNITNLAKMIIENTDSKIIEEKTISDIADQYSLSFIEFSRLCSILSDYDIQIINSSVTKIKETKETVTQNVESITAEEWLISQLNTKKIAYKDNRDKNGCLWIVGGYELMEFIRECNKKGYFFNYKPTGCKCFPEQAVWWTKNQNWRKVKE